MFAGDYGLLIDHYIDPATVRLEQDPTGQTYVQWAKLANDSTTIYSKYLEATDYQQGRSTIDSITVELAIADTLQILAVESAELLVSPIAIGGEGQLPKANGLTDVGATENPDTATKPNRRSFRVIESNVSAAKEDANTLSVKLNPKPEDQHKSLGARLKIKTEPRSSYTENEIWSGDLLNLNKANDESKSDMVNNLPATSKNKSVNESDYGYTAASSWFTALPNSFLAFTRAEAIT
jgi:hypothetical protein